MNKTAPYSLVSWIVIAFLFLVLIGTNTFLSLSTIKELDTLQTKIRLSDRTLIALNEVHVNLLTAESGQRGFLLVQDTAYLEYFTSAVEKVTELLNALSQQQSQSTEETDMISALTLNVKMKVQELKYTIMLANNDKIEDALETVRTDQGRLLYDEILRIIEQLKGYENRLRTEQTIQLQQVRSESKRNNIISFITSLLLVAGILVLARMNAKNHQQRQNEIEQQNQALQLAVDERTKELSINSDELMRSNRELEDFAFVASHDLQEPLRKIMAFGDRLYDQSDNLSERQSDYLSRMVSAASRMSTLINDLLEFSRISTRGKPFERVDVNTVIANCIEDLNILIEETGATFLIDDAPELFGDRTQIQQLFFNLLANAVKFSKKDGNPKVIVKVRKVAKPQSIEIENLKDWYQFSVIDNGIGFDQEYAEKIFAPFQRLHSRSSYKGTGIGLAICRRIVERHNGTIEATGVIDGGASFEVTLPAINRIVRSG